MNEVTHCIHHGIQRQVSHLCISLIWRHDEVHTLCFQCLQKALYLTRR